MSEVNPEHPASVNEASDTDTGMEGESFEKLLAESEASAVRLRPGESTRATVISVSGDLVFINLGGKREGAVSLDEFKDDDGIPQVNEGDEIDAFFVSKRDGILRFTTLIHGHSPAKLKSVRDAQESGSPVTGDVKREVKGGFEVYVNGLRCFCPFSHIDLRAGREGGSYVGQTLSFKVLEFKENGRNIVVSRRAILEDEREARLKEVKETLEVGAEVTGVVRSVQKFGAFVNLFDAVDALIPVSEMAWGRVRKPEDVVSVGDEVRCRVLSLDWDKNRLSLSLKAMQQDPWESVPEKYPVDAKVGGTVVRLESFGAFVNLEPGIDGLIHISNLGADRRINHPKEVVETGQWVDAYVLQVDTAKRKISLSLQPKFRPESIPLPEMGEIVSGVVEKIMPYGVFLKMESGLTGLIPNAEMGTPRGTDHSKMFDVGTEMQVAVIEVDKSHHRVKLSRKAVSKQKEQIEFDRYRETVKQETEGGEDIGSLGQLLKAKMDENKVSI